MMYTPDEYTYYKDTFFSLQSRSDVAAMLNISLKQLNYLLYVSRPENQYETFSISKRSGGYRIIHAPLSPLKIYQKRLANILNCIYEPKNCVYGFVPSKNIVSNAACHAHKKIILNIDLQNFFDQIHFGRIRGMFMAKPYSLGSEAATTIAQLVCYKGTLPQGAPSSPILTNMICSSLDQKLIRLAKKYNLHYTRYADDITFSSNRKNLSDEIVYIDKFGIHLGEELQTCLNEAGFTVNPKKIFLNRLNTRQEVTGLTVNNIPNPKREYLKNLRALLHHCQVDGIYATALKYIQSGHCNNPYIKDFVNSEDTEQKKELIINWFLQVLRGKILFIKQVRGKENGYFIKYARELNVLCKKEIISYNESLNFYQKIEEGVLVITSTNETKQGTGFLLDSVGLVSCFHVIPDDNFYCVHKYTKTPKEESIVVSNENSLILNNSEKDYTILDCPRLANNYHWPIAKRVSLNLGDEITFIGYPSWQLGSTPYIQKCTIVRRKTYLGNTLYEISGRILHGASGGIVLNKKEEVIGIIRAGAENISEAEEKEEHGFISIFDVCDELEDFKKMD